MALDDDTFSDSDNNSSSTTYIDASCYGHGHRHNSSPWALVIILVVIVVIAVIASSADKSYGARREQQTDALIMAWARSMNVTVAVENGQSAYSCKHEPSRALCDVRLTNGERKHLSCGKGGCSER
jgi:hypothetical protein